MHTTTDAYHGCYSYEYGQKDKQRIVDVCIHIVLVYYSNCIQLQRSHADENDKYYLPA